MESQASTEQSGLLAVDLLCTVVVCQITHVDAMTLPTYPSAKICTKLGSVMNSIGVPANRQVPIIPISVLPSCPRFCIEARPATSQQ